MSALIRARRPALRHLVGDVCPHIESLGILRLHPIDEDERLEQLLFGELPDVARIGRHLALQRVHVVGDERAEEFVGHRIELPAQPRTAPLSPEHAAHFRMRRQIFLDPFADGVAAAVIGARRRAGIRVFASRAARAPGGFAARALFRRVRVVLHLAGLAREQLFVDVGPPRLQPRFRLRRIRELVLDPLRRLIDARLRDVVALLPARDARVGGFSGLAGHLVDELHVRRDLALAERALDRVEHHRVGVVVGDDQNLIARLQDAHALALQPRLIAHERSRGVHQVVDRLGRLEVRRPARLGILLAVRAGACRGARRFGAPFIGASARGSDNDGGEKQHARQPDRVRSKFHRPSSSRGAEHAGKHWLCGSLRAPRSHF